MEAPHPVPSLRREGPALLGAGAGDSGDFPEDADPAASPDGKRRHGPSDRPPSGAAESRIWINGLGSGSMPGARRFSGMGSAPSPAPQGAFALPLGQLFSAVDPS